MPEIERRPDPNPRLGIVIVTYERRDRLLATLERLTGLEARYPIVVVDNASTDGTAAAVRRRFPSVDVIERSQNIGGVARNDGVRALSTELIAFADDDSWYAAGSLATAIELFARHPELGLVMSRVLLAADGRLDPCCELMRRSPLPNDGRLPGTPILGFVACAAIVRRSAFLAAGGFDERHGTGGEEALVAWSLADLGWALRYVPEVVAYHAPAPRTAAAMRSRRIEGIALEISNAWSRRSLRTAVSVTVHHLRRTLHSDLHRAGVLRAMPQALSALRRRRPLGPELEAQLELLERPADDSAETSHSV